MVIDQELRKRELTKVIQFVKDKELQTKSRKRNKVYLRSYLIIYLTEVIGLTLEEAGEVVNRHHTTAIHLKKVYEQYRKDPYYLRMIKDALDLFPIKRFDAFNNEYKILELALRLNVYNELKLLKIVENFNSIDELINDLLKKQLRNEIKLINDEPINKENQ